MILTGKAAEYAEGFEDFDREVRQKLPNHKLLELTEGEQINLFQIMMMFERDEAFKHFMSACLHLYMEKTLEGQRALLEMINKMRKL